MDGEGQRMYSGAAVRWRRGQLPPPPQFPQTTALNPKCDMKHCLTNSKHQHIGAKSSVQWPPKYENLFPAGALPPDPIRGAHDARQTPSRLERGHPSPYLPNSTPLAPQSILLSMGATTGGSGSPDPPKFGRTHNFYVAFWLIECDYVTYCTKLGRPVYFFQ